MPWTLTANFHSKAKTGHARIRGAALRGRRKNGTVAERKEAFQEDLYIPEPSRWQLRTHAINCAVPMIGFGTMDNLVMIQAGDFIDNHIGVVFGMSTLTAAAFGQIFSDVSGVCFGGVVERAAKKLGLPNSGLTPLQQELPRVKTLSTASAVGGVIIGCLIGMSCLLFMDLEKAERAKRSAELDTIFATVLEDGHQLLHAEKVTLFMVDKEQQQVWSRVKTGEEVDTLRELRASFDELDTDGNLVTLDEVMRALAQTSIVTDVRHVKRVAKERGIGKDWKFDHHEFKKLIDELMSEPELRSCEIVCYDHFLS